MADYKVETISIVMTLTDSTVLNIDERHIMLGSLRVEEASSSETEFQIGTAISKKLSFQLNNAEDTFSPYDFNDAVVAASMTVTEPDGDENVPVVIGVFYVTEKPVYNGNTITFTCLDGMYKLDAPYTTAIVYSGAGVSIQTVYDELVTNVGLVKNESYIPTSMGIALIPRTPAFGNCTYADVLCWICQVCGTFAQILPNGKLTMRYYRDDSMTTHLLDETYSMQVDTDDVVITGVKVTECFDEDETYTRSTFLWGTEDYALHIEENPLVVRGFAETVAKAVANYYAGRKPTEDWPDALEFRPYRITIPKDPTIHVGDEIELTDYKGNTFHSYVTAVTFQTNNATTVSMGAASPSRNAATHYSSAARALSESKRLVTNEKTAREAAIENLQDQLDNASGMYEIRVEDPVGSGSYIYYLADRPTLAESTAIMRIDDVGISFSTDGGQTYSTGLDYTGNAILNMIYAVGINANYINSGSITVEKTTENDPMVTVLVDTYAQSSSGERLHSHSAKLNGGSVNIVREVYPVDADRHPTTQYPTVKDESYLTANQVVISMYAGDGTSSPAFSGRAGLWTSSSSGGLLDLQNGSVSGQLCAEDIRALLDGGLVAQDYGSQVTLSGSGIGTATKHFWKRNGMVQVYMNVPTTAANTNITVTIPADIKAIGKYGVLNVYSGTAPYAPIGSAWFENATTAHIYLPSSARGFYVSGTYMTE